MARSALAQATPSLRAVCDWRSLKSADFAFALTVPAVGKSAHFVLHHVAAHPASAVRRPKGPIAKELSTAAAPNQAPFVDNTQPPPCWWLGLVVPKRHAKRSVTRSLLKRQMRAQVQGSLGHLPAGQWVIRLRAPFGPSSYASAGSAALREAARKELEQVFAALPQA
jgi:ribonuclease P protein component